MILAMPIAVLVVLADQITKYLIIHRFALGESVVVLPGIFDLRYIRNTGAAWGIFSGYNTVLVPLSFVMIILLTVFRRHFVTDAKIHRVALGLMIGGIVGNLIDRVKWQYVIDFLDFYFRTSHFPAFNVADSSICTGVALYILAQFLIKDRPHAGAEELASVKGNG
jgi:signal peptidase II